MNPQLTSQQLYAKGDKALSEQFRNLVITDYDHCSCYFEKFDVNDTMLQRGIVVLVNGEPCLRKSDVYDGRIAISAREQMSDEIFIKCLKRCMDLAVPLADVNLSYQTVIGRNPERGYANHIYMDIDETYVVPDPEFFGVYVNNFEGFGLMLFGSLVRLD